MDYQSAFTKIINQHGLEILDNNFLVHSFLLDLIGGDKRSIELAEAFFILNDESVYLKISGKKLSEIAPLLDGLIRTLDRSYTSLIYLLSIEPLLIHLFPYEYVKLNPNIKHGAPKIVKAPHNKSMQSVHITPVQITPQVKKKVVVDSYIINARCRGLSIVCSNNKKIRIIDKGYHDVTKQFKPKKSKNIRTLNIEGRHNSFYLFLPKKRYKNVTINFKGVKLSLTGDHNNNFKCEQLEINANKINGQIFVDSDVISGKIDKGTIQFYGEIKNIVLNYGDVDVKALIKGVNANRYMCKVNKGNIEINFLDIILKSKVRHIFKGSINVHNTYNVNGRQMELKLSTDRGKINVL
ncbi:MAG: hypothetical protein K5925_02115 [Bacilli bacterium]|nr:hypothetical protein [Bacilli bacterium]